VIGKLEGPRERRHTDVLIGLSLTGAAALIYALSFHPDWIYDPLRYAELMQRGPVRVLLGPQHALGNLLPLAVFRAARGLGYGGQAMPVLAGFSVFGASLAVGATYLAAVRLGGSRFAAVTAAALLGVAAAPWRAGGSGGVYGIALATLAVGWLAAAGYLRSPGVRAAGLLGVAGGVAIGGHLANVAFVAAAVVLVVTVSPREHRVRSLGALALGAVVAAGAVFLLTAGVATGWSIPGMKDWLLHPGIGGATDRSSLVGWGVAGLFPAFASGQPHVSWLPFGLDEANGHLEILVTLLLLGAAFVRGVLLAARSRTGAALAGALVLNTGLAFLLASWHQALRADYWGLGLVPLAVMGGAGTVSFRRRSPVRRAATVGVALATVAALLAWNASQEVAPSLELSDKRAGLVEALAQRAPSDSHIVISLILAGRLADRGYDAEGGFAALQNEVRGGAPKPGVAALVADLDTRPLFISSAAFGFTAGQARFLGATGRDVWRALHECCVLQPILGTSGLPRDETVFRLRARTR
jgi:hypothetical protein